MAKYVTIIDIARELGISKSTVSRALSGDTGNVKAETLQRILETAERMGYHRNELAVNFRQQSTHNIGIIIPEIVTTFYMTFINDAQAILRKQGYKVMIAISNENPELFRRRKHAAIGPAHLRSAGRTQSRRGQDLPSRRPQRHRPRRALLLLRYDQ